MNANRIMETTKELGGRIRETVSRWFGAERKGERHPDQVRGTAHQPTQGETHTKH